MPKPAGSSRSQAIVQALQEANKPLTFDELLDAARAIFPFDVKTLKAALNNLAGSYSPNSRLIQRTVDGRYAWLPNLVAGAIFRHALSKEELKQHHLILEPEILAALWPGQVSWRLDESGVAWNCNLPNGIRMAMRPERLGQKGWGLTWGIRGEPALWEWLESVRAQGGDALLLQIENVGNSRLTLESRTSRDETRVAQRNSALADAADTGLKSRQRGVSLTDVAARVIAFGIYHDACPPDSLETVLKSDARFMWENGRVKLATRYDHLSATLGLEEPDLLEEKPRRSRRKRPPRKQLADQVYRFYAAFRYGRTIWRRIEIRGNQSLGELDTEMRAAFGHDLSDHLSEFYLGTDADSYRRGLGAHNPFGGGDGDKWMVGELGLAPEDKLSYTYDFGDNIQHVLKLEAIVPPEPRAKYPRVVEQNKPRYHYCEVCKKRGKQEIAAWICIQCSNEQQRRVLICEEHLDKHEDHYTEELVY